MDLQETPAKVPKRIVHFSDGSVPEYSTDEEETNKPSRSTKTIQINPSFLGWIDWIRFKTEGFGSSALNICDSLGYSLSSFFGITTPKYQFEIDHYNLMKKLENDISDTELGMMTKNGKYYTSTSKK